jgi:hypothetical protein
MWVNVQCIILLKQMIIWLYLSDTYSFNYVLIVYWKETAGYDLYE